MHDLDEIETLPELIERFLTLSGKVQQAVMDELLNEVDLLVDTITKSGGLGLKEWYEELANLAVNLRGKKDLYKIDDQDNMAPMLGDDGEIIQELMKNILNKKNALNEQFLKKKKELQYREVEKVNEYEEPLPLTAGQILALINVIILLLVFAAIAVTVAFIPLAGPFLVGLAVAVSKFIGFTTLTTALTTTATAITLPFTVAGVGAAVMAGVLLVVDAGVAVGLGIKNRMLKNQDETVVSDLLEKNKIEENKSPSMMTNAMRSHVNFISFRGKSTELKVKLNEPSFTNALFLDSATHCYIYCLGDNIFCVGTSRDDIMRPLIVLDNKISDILQIKNYFPVCDENDNYQVKKGVEQKEVNYLRAVLVNRPLVELDMNTMLTIPFADTRKQMKESNSEEVNDVYKSTGYKN